MSITRKNSTSSPLPILAEPKASLERAFFEAYLKSKGYTLETLNCLTRSHARRLRIQASIYASGKLAEIEARSHLVDDLHGEFA